MHVVERLGDCAVLEKHDAVGDPHRHDFRERRSAQQRLARLAGAGENAERAGAVTEIGKQAAGPVGCVVGITAVDEIARDVRTQALRQRMMVGIVSGVEVCNSNLGRNLRAPECGDGVIEL